MSKHTAGPWRVVSGAVETVNGIPIASMDRESGNGTVPVERDCNAALIAAAPELLEACKQLIANIQVYGDGTAYACTLDVEAMERTIAKAEG